MSSRQTHSESDSAPKAPSEHSREVSPEQAGFTGGDWYRIEDGVYWAWPVSTAGQPQRSNILPDDETS